MVTDVQGLEMMSARALYGLALVLIGVVITSIGVRSKAVAGQQGNELAFSQPANRFRSRRGCLVPRCRRAIKACS